MKPWMLSFLVVGMVAGCSTPSGSTVVTPGGTVSTTNGPGGKVTTSVNTPDGKSVSSTTEGGKTTVTGSGGEKLVTGSDKVPNFGVDVYPGLKMVAGSAVEAETGQAKSASANFTTDDTVEKVVDFYKGKLGPTATVSNQTDNGSTLAFVTKTDGKVIVSVTISRNKDEKQTNVTLTRNEQ